MSEIDPKIIRQLIEGPQATVFVDIPGGNVRMGSTARADEQPVHEVVVSPFSAALTPVSNAHYGRFLEQTGHEPPGFWDEERFNASDCPVVGVSWFDAVAYCDWLSRLTGRRCRLPAEAEREYAARGGVEGVLYPWGDEPWSEGVHAFDSAGGDRPHPIGASPPNGYGLFHMGDNVHEWCSDWYARDGYAFDAARPAPLVDPRGPREGSRRTSRGGSWRHRIKVARIAARSSLDPGFRYNDYGMRVYADI